MALRNKLIALAVPAIGAVLRTWKRRRGATGTAAEDLSARDLARADRTAGVTERYLLYCMIPLWVVSGFLDYVWHRKTSIQTTAGVTESAIHCLMMAEAGLPMVLCLVLEVNAGLILLTILAFFAHTATAIWDVSFAVERRKVTPTEQHIHSFLEVLPFSVVSFVICLHPDQALALVGGAQGKARFHIERKRPPLPKSYIAGALAAATLNAGLYGEELVRCIRARRAGLEGVNRPPAARELYAE